MHSRLISGSPAKREVSGGGNPISMAYPTASSQKPSFRLTGSRRDPPPCTGTAPDFIPRVITSGPAHKVDPNPPSRARVEMTPPLAVSDRRRSARYRFDLPEPFAPVTT